MYLSLQIPQILAGEWGARTVTAVNENMRVDQSTIAREQRTSKAIPKQGAHMIQTSCVWEVELTLTQKPSGKLNTTHPNSAYGNGNTVKICLSRLGHQGPALEDITGHTAFVDRTCDRLNTSTCQLEGGST